MSSIVNFFNALGTFIETASKSNVFRVLSLGVGAIVLYSGYENRNALIEALVTSDTALISLGVGCLIMLIGWIFRSIINRMDDTQQKNEQLLRERIESLEREVQDCRTECRTEAQKTHEEIKIALIRIEEMMRGNR